MGGARVCVVGGIGKNKTEFGFSSSKHMTLGHAYLISALLSFVGNFI